MGEAPSSSRRMEEEEKSADADAGGRGSARRRLQLPRALLLEAGANVNARDRWDSVVLYYARLAGHAETTRMLLEAGAIYAERTFNGDRCHYAALNLCLCWLLKSFEARPPPLGPLPAALWAIFLACPANRAAFQGRAGAEAASLAAATGPEPDKIHELTWNPASRWLRRYAVMCSLALTIFTAHFRLLTLTLNLRIYCSCSPLTPSKDPQKSGVPLVLPIAKTDEPTPKAPAPSTNGGLTRNQKKKIRRKAKRAAAATSEGSGAVASADTDGSDDRGDLGTTNEGSPGQDQAKKRATGDRRGSKGAKKKWQWRLT